MIDHLWPSGMQLGSPWALLLLIAPLALLVISLRHHPRTVIVSTLPEATALLASWRVRLLWLPAVLRTLGMGALIVAMARPQLGIGRVETSAEAVAIELVVDRSGSMAQEMTLNGASRTRLEVVKQVVKDFLLGDGADLKGRASDLVGVVSFAGFAQTVCPPVRDPRTLAKLVESIPLAQYTYENGTQIGEGLALAAARLHSAEQDLKNRTDAQQFENLRIKSKVCILLTDGRNTGGERTPLEAAQFAKERGIKVYTIGIGAGVDSFVVQQTPFGDRRVRVPSDVDEPLLQQIAEMTGGIYRRAQDGETLRKIYHEIDQLEKTSVQTVQFVDFSEKFMPFAATGAAFITISTLLASSLFRRTAA